MAAAAAQGEGSGSGGAGGAAAAAGRGERQPSEESGGGVSQGEEQRRWPATGSRSSGGDRVRGAAAERGATVAAQAGEWLFPFRSDEAGWWSGGGVSRGEEQQQRSAQGETAAAGRGAAAAAGRGAEPAAGGGACGRWLHGHGRLPGRGRRPAGPPASAVPSPPLLAKTATWRSSSCMSWTVAAARAEQAAASTPPSMAMVSGGSRQRGRIRWRRPPLPPWPRRAADPGGAGGTVSPREQRRQRGSGLPSTAFPRWRRRRTWWLFLFILKIFAECHLNTRRTVCRVPKKDTRQKSYLPMFVCREPFAVCYTRHWICRVFTGLCRVQQTHSKPPVSGSGV